MTSPQLVKSDALVGVHVGISVSDSADMARLGLAPRHAELAIGEIARAIIVGGGSLAYGGRIKPSGFTQQLMNEVRRYGTTRPSLTIYLALPEHQKLSLSELDETDRELGTWGRLITLDEEGSPISWRNGRPPEGSLVESAEQRQASFSSLRRFMTEDTEARVLLGGQLRRFEGAMPGVIEEALFAVRARQPLYLAGGFGGATTAAARALEAGRFDWLPSDLPQGQKDPRVVDSLRLLVGAADDAGWSAQSNGLSEEENNVLAASHRPGEVASLVVLGLARWLAAGTEQG
jgi:hypothetical protein